MILNEIQITSLLNKPLPGEQAQLLMAPHAEGTTAGPVPKPGPNTRESGVLLLLSPHPESLRTQFTLTLRSSRLLSHSGQLSLPGGRIEKGETPEQAALRETYEEIGVPVHAPRMLGRLTPLHVPHSGNLIYPVVAWIDKLPALTLEPFEVSEAFQVDVATLSDPHKQSKETWNLRNQTLTVPFWRVHQKVPLWGATAMILSEFMQLLSRSADNFRDRA
ncbi:MAG: CoA pyrophosphatase [Bacteroidetes bacterium]|nr:CoA pyrophosphatase [Bacteroidota bacterium]MCH8524707.1 CoA pyrophosphatase [Balneolales bacterium]